MAKIYLHWTATNYNWVRSGSYHTVVTGDGKLNRLHDYNVDLPAHTYGRNNNSIGISCACMGGNPDPWTMPPTNEQIEAMCKEVARVAQEWGWTEDKISVENIMTHAEAASNRDGWIAHENYGPAPWDGTGERWDFMQLTKSGSDNGGDILRDKIRGYFRAPVSSSPLKFVRESQIEANGKTLHTLIDEHGASWAKAVNLLSIYDLSFQWQSSERRILVGNLDVTPKYLEDQVQADVGYPLFEMSLQRQNAPIILVGIIRDHSAYCKVYEFAQEFGITVSLNPFKLGRRLGG
jgi:hypothetical protein